MSVTKYLGRAASRGSVCFSLQFDGTVHHDREDAGKEHEVAGQEAERNECPCKCSLLSMQSVDWVVKVPEGWLRDDSQPHQVHN